MKKHPDLLSVLVQTANHPFRHADTRPGRARQHRYERRKIRECLRRGHWHPGPNAPPAG